MLASYCLFSLAETPQFCGLYMYFGPKHVCVILKTTILNKWVGFGCLEGGALFIYCWVIGLVADQDIF